MDGDSGKSDSTYQSTTEEGGVKVQEVQEVQGGCPYAAYALSPRVLESRYEEAVDMDNPTTYTMCYMARRQAGAEKTRTVRAWSRVLSRCLRYIVPLAMARQGVWHMIHVHPFLRERLFDGCFYPIPRNT
jgi:hypothetical protein